MITNGENMILYNNMRYIKFFIILKIKIILFQLNYPSIIYWFSIIYLLLHKYIYVYSFILIIFNQKFMNIKLYNRKIIINFLPIIDVHRKS